MKSTVERNNDNVLKTPTYSAYLVKRSVCWLLFQMREMTNDDLWTCEYCTAEICVRVCHKLAMLSLLSHGALIQVAVVGDRRAAWKLEDAMGNKEGRVKVEDGRWKMEGGRRWKMDEDGGLKVVKGDEVRRVGDQLTCQVPCVSKVRGQEGIHEEEDVVEVR